MTFDYDMILSKKLNKYCRLCCFYNKDGCVRPINTTCSFYRAYKRCKFALNLLKNAMETFINEK